MHELFVGLIRRTAYAHAQFSGCSSITNAHSETGQMAVCCQNLPLDALISRIAFFVLVGALFKKFGLFLNTGVCRKKRILPPCLNHGFAHCSLLLRGRITVTILMSGGVVPLIIPGRPCIIIHKRPHTHAYLTQ